MMSCFFTCRPFLISHIQAIVLYVIDQIIQGFLPSTVFVYPDLLLVSIFRKCWVLLLFEWSLWCNFCSEWSKEVAAAAFSARKPSLGKAVARFALVELIYVGVFGFLNVSCLPFHIQKQLVVPSFSICSNFSIILYFRIWVYFVPFFLLGFGVIFRCSVVSFGVIFCYSIF